MYSSRAITVQEYLAGRASDLFYRVNGFVATLPEKLGILESNLTDGYNSFKALEDIGVSSYLFRDRSNKGHKARRGGKHGTTQWFQRTSKKQRNSPQQGSNAPQSDEKK